MQDARVLAICRSEPVLREFLNNKLREADQDSFTVQICLLDLDPLCRSKTNYSRPPVERRIKNQDSCPLLLPRYCCNSVFHRQLAALIKNQNTTWDFEQEYFCVVKIGSDECGDGAVGILPSSNLMTSCATLRHKDTTSVACDFTTRVKQAFRQVCPRMPIPWI